MLYHVSPTAGLKRLVPRVSSHGKAYVYAIENLVTALTFGAKWDDFDFHHSTDEQDRPVLLECYPDAFRAVYQGKQCSVYKISEEGFQPDQTSWETELVCEREVPVLEETIVHDLYERLLEEESQGRIVIQRYEPAEPYRRLIATHVTNRLVRFNVDLCHACESDPRFATYYRDIIELLRSATDGHLLP